MLDDDTMRLLAIDLANRFNEALMEFDAGVIEAIVTRALGYMLANNALRSGSRQALVDMLTDVCQHALRGYDIEIKGRENN